MSAKSTKLPGSVVVETTGTNLSFFRQPAFVGGSAVGMNTQLNAGYADHSYLVDDSGKKVKLLTANENSRNLPMDAAAFNAEPVTYKGKDTTLGEVINALWDAAIEADLAKQAAQ